MEVDFACSRCGACGSIVVNPATSIADVMQRVSEAHRSKQPTCQLSAEHLTLTSPALTAGRA